MSVSQTGPRPKRAFVIGHPIAHSRSPMLHGHWLETLGLAGVYEARDVAPEALPAFFENLRAEGYVGGNVTVPHKLAVIPFLAEIDEAARAIGAVNTIWLEGGRLVGGNTDAYGFLGNLDQLAPGWDAAGGVAVVLGAGGAARAAVYALLSRGFAVRLVNRTPATARDLAAHFGEGVTAHDWTALPALLPEANLLVNTTSLGMLGKPPLDIDLTQLKAGAVVNDIVYVPLDTPLLRQARARGLRTVDGLGMLLHQAVAGFAHWFGVTPSVTPALRALLEADIRAKTPGA
ncbi:shikimate dehydrogenase [Alsobacter sp. SYSU M60028]|uniref:Shikimate dehydrogenase (NADP(+)) n=1 Tax=Alsobacter ponti TaxID=2962936 RepID=A0ABT1LBB2_9HYPH|nr:shikimate dehydrogenase [Alsobacter ponti]MCP8938776.1 shikimate dehydrogenase [Alsobacter ponti]